MYTRTPAEYVRYPVVSRSPLQNRGERRFRARVNWTKLKRKKSEQFRDLGISVFFFFFFHLLVPYYTLVFRSCVYNRRIRVQPRRPLCRYASPWKAKHRLITKVLRPKRGFNSVINVVAVAVDHLNWIPPGTQYTGRGDVFVFFPPRPLAPPPKPAHGKTLSSDDRGLGRAPLTPLPRAASRWIFSN